MYFLKNLLIIYRKLIDCNYQINPSIYSVWIYIGTTVRKNGLTENVIKLYKYQTENDVIVLNLPIPQISLAMTFRDIVK